MNIQWIIEQMGVKPQVDGEADVVVTAAWRCNGRDGEYSATVYGTASFTLAQGGSFTPYDQLTQDQVVSWCWANSVDKDEVEANVARQIDTQINPPVISPKLPWSNA